MARLPPGPHGLDVVSGGSRHSAQALEVSPPMASDMLARLAQRTP
jgi:hypothetical protein